MNIVIIERITALRYNKMRREKRVLCNESNLFCNYSYFNLEEVTIIDYTVVSYLTEVLDIRLLYNSGLHFMSVTIDVNCPQNLRTRTTTKHINRALTEIGLTMSDSELIIAENLLWRCWYDKSADTQHAYIRKNLH